MPTSIDDEIAAVGSASVIVMLKAAGVPKRGRALTETAAAAAMVSSVDPSELKKYFEAQKHPLDYLVLIIMGGSSCCS